MSEHGLIELMMLVINSHSPDFDSCVSLVCCSSDANRRLSVENRSEAGSPRRRSHPSLLPPQESASPEALHAGCSRHPAQKLQVTHTPVSPAHSDQLRPLSCE